MHIRQATRADIPCMGDIQAVANLDDTLVRFTTQHTDKYFESYRQSSVRYIRKLFVEPGVIAFVAETDRSDYQDKRDRVYRAPEVVGFAMWQRVGSCETAQEWRRKLNGSWLSSFERLMEGVDRTYRAWFPRTDITTHPANAAKVSSYLAQQDDKDILDEYWELVLFFCHPDWRRRGVGRGLVAWGLERAQQEKVPVRVCASPIGTVAYESYGFQMVRHFTFDAMFDVMANGGKLPGVLLWEPKLVEGDKVEGRWRERLAARYVLEGDKRTPRIVLPTAL